MDWNNLPYADLSLLLAWSLLATLALAGLFAPALASAGQWTSSSETRAFRDKFAYQISGMGLGLLFAVVIAMAGAQAYLYSMAPELFPAVVKPYALLAAASMLLALFCALLYHGLWRRLRQAKTVRKLLGLLAALAALLAAYLVLGFKRALLLTPELFSTMPMPEALRLIYGPPASSLFWPLLVQTLLAGLTCASGLGLIHLILRRARDDYGRDYYNASLKYCARWALVPTLLQLAPMALIVSRLGPSFGLWDMNNVMLLGFGLAAVMLLLAVALWAVVARSNNPLRQKPAIFLAMLFPILAMALEAAPFLIQALAYQTK